MFTSNFTVDDAYLKHLRGQDNLKKWSQNHSIASHDPKTGERTTMTNYFCATCGTLMYRVSSAFLGMSFLRIGTVDDFTLQETKLRPQMEIFVKDRVSWLSGVEGAQEFEASWI